MTAHVQHAGVPGVKPERLAEGKEPQHCALSLVGEPIMYPQINTLVRLLHQRLISTFLVTNAQFPGAIKYMHKLIAVILYRCLQSLHFSS